MTHQLRRGAAAAFLAALALAALPAVATAQYFGRNKVQYEDFDFRILRSDRFDFYYYPAESLATSDMARAGDRWYTRLSDLFRHTFDRKSVVFYADHPDFQQTNVVGGAIGEGTGGITEGLRTRVVMPHTGSYWDTDHVLGHEIVHVFQYNIAEGGPGGINALGQLPLWLIEGMSEYLSIGRQHSLTAMWLRDALMRDDLPTIKKLDTDPKYFPYRYGQALWAYIGGRYGDRAVIDVFRAALRLGWDPAIRRVLGVNSDTLSAQWIASIRAQYQPHLAGRVHPDSVGQNIIQVTERGGDYNISPIVSPDGRHVAFYSSRDLFGIDLYLADAQTGRIIKKLAAPSTGRHLDAISFIQSAGDFSPDGRQFAFISFSEGDNEIELLDVASTRLTRRVQVPNVGAMNSLAWSPDGRSIAFSGMVGGVSDIYVFDVAAGTVRQLTNDRYADLHPAWSPDGRSIAFSSDRGPGTNFETMTYSKMQLARVDVATGEVDVFAAFPTGRHINPQYTPDGRSVLFIADPDGVSNIYRLDLGTRALSQVTNVATGISGITDLSPAMSIAENTGRLVFNVFRNQGHSIVALAPEQTVGTPVTAQPTYAAAMLPPGDTPGRAPITTYLADALTGLSAASSFEHLAYTPRFSLDAIGQVGAGVSAGGPFGTGVQGGVSAYFGDQLGDQLIGVGVQAQGQIQDIGGSLFYLNMEDRFNWGAQIAHEPYLTGGTQVTPASDPDIAAIGGLDYNLFLRRIFFSQASLIGQYPLSTTRRVEANVSANRIGFSMQVDRLTVVPAGTGYQAVDRQLLDLDSPPATYYGQASLAYVGDWSNSAYTSPISGGRYRFEVSPTFGERNLTSLLADYRRYHFKRPVTFAWRALHYGNYGRDAEDWSDMLTYPMFLGEQNLVRGYAYQSFDPSEECTLEGGGLSGCPVFDRLVGSRMAVFNAELRIPLTGGREFGLINLPFLPIELSPFFDAGVMWTSDQAPQLRWDRESNTQPADCSALSVMYGICAERIPVFSTGVSARFNVLGYLILEAYAARPFQRPEKNWVYGFQLMPGW